MEISKTLIVMFLPAAILIVAAAAATWRYMRDTIVEHRAEIDRLTLQNAYLARTREELTDELAKLTIEAADMRRDLVQAKDLFCGY